MTQDQPGSSVPDRIEHDIVIHAPIERVWRVLTEPRYVAQWYAFDGADLDLRPGGALAFYWKEHGAFHGRVAGVDPPHRFAYQFAALTPEEQPRQGNATLVEFTLDWEGAATRLRIVESGIAGLDVPAAEQHEHAAHSNLAWANGLAGLRQIAERV